MIAKPVRSRSHSAGLSLIELMIAMAIGVFLVGGVLQVFVSSRQAYRTGEAIAEIQENGRFAMELLSREIRHAAFKGGCPTDVAVNNLLNTAHLVYDPFRHLPTPGLTGWSGAAGPFAADMTNYIAGTDVLLVRHAAIAPLSIVAANPLAPNAAANVNIALTGASGIPKGQIVIISDSDSCDIFQNQGENTDLFLSRSAGGSSPETSPGNRAPAANPLSKTYTDNAQLHVFSSQMFYVGLGAGATPRPALRRVDYSRGGPIDQELVEGVVGLELNYGIGDNTGRVTHYIPANAVTDWSNVLAVRVRLLLQSDNAGGAPVAMPAVTINGATWPANANDRRIYQFFESTIGVRNQLP